MPEYPQQKLYTGAIDPPTEVAACEFAYAELDVTTNYSFLRGASHPDELVYMAAMLGYKALAITDVNSVAGVVRAFEAAKKVKDFQLIVGARLVFEDGTPDVLVWPMDRDGYAQLCRLLTVGRMKAGKGECRLTLDDLLTHHEGLLAAVEYETMHGDDVGCAPAHRENGVLPHTLRITDDFTLSHVLMGEGRVRALRFTNPISADEAARPSPHVEASPPLPSPGVPGEGAELRLAKDPLHLLREAFGDRLSLSLHLDFAGDDDAKLDRVRELSKQTDIPLLATNHVHYHDANRRSLQDVLTCVRHGRTIHDAGHNLFPNAERYLKSPEQMRRLFELAPEAIERGLEIISRCQFKLDDLKYEYPTEAVPPGESPSKHLRKLAWLGAAERYPQGIPKKVQQLLIKELKFICGSKYESYFLTVHDLVRYARSQKILCQGRGSAANSAVCYCLGVTAVDPDKFQLVFERFASNARAEPPDIDVDFEHERREEVIQYVYTKYGRDRAAMTASLITYRGRSAVRDVGKALGFSQDALDQLAGKLDWWHRGTLTDSQLKEAGVDPREPSVRLLIELTSELLGFPRHLSQHVGGMVISRSPIHDLVPIENAAMKDRTVIEWDKDDLDALQMFKVDILALGMLTCLSKGIKLVNDLAGCAPAHRENGAQAHNLAATPSPLEGEGGGEGCEADAQNDSQTSRCFPSRLPAQPRTPPSRGGGPERAKPLELHTIPHEDPATYDMLCHADSIGVFQVESRAQMSMLPRLQPRKFYDLVVEVAIVRPGPIQGNMVHPYLQRREMQRKDPSFRVPYPKPELAEVLHETLGVPLFQEQAMRMAIVAAGFSADEADQLRRAMAAWKRSAGLGRFHDKFVNGMLQKGYEPQFAEDCFNQIAGFGEYGFPESHAASFAKLVEASAWLKRHHPAAFACALLNSQPMGFYAPAQIVRDAREHGVEVRAVDVNCSDWDGTLESPAPLPLREGYEAEHEDDSACSRWLKTPCARGPHPPHPSPLPQGEREPEAHPTQLSAPLSHVLMGEGRVDRLSQAQSAHAVARPSPQPSPGVPGEGGKAKHTWGLNGPSLRLGFREIKGMKQADALRIMEARTSHGPFESMAQLQRLANLDASCIRRLAKADAFASLALSRRPATWEALALADAPAPILGNADRDDAIPPMLPFMQLGEEVLADYSTTGLSLKRHPVSFVRDELAKSKIVRAIDLKDSKRFPHGRWVRVAGLVLVRQRPGTASGVVFVTIEDETGVANLILWAHIYDRYRPAARHATLLHAEGIVQREGEVIHVLAHRLYDRTPLLRGLSQPSRDFH